MTDHFRNWLDDKKTDDESMLPMTHITKSMTSRDIVSAGHLTPMPCNVMGKDLLYTFYGRVGFRILDEDILSAVTLCPVCFIIKPTTIKRLATSYPFDTGAYKARMYKNHLGDEFQLDSFELKREPARFRTIISEVYETSLDYIEANLNKVKKPEDVTDPTNFEMYNYVNLVRSEGRNTDDRVGSIEVIFDEKLLLGNDIECVIMPSILTENLKDDSWFHKLPKTVKVKTYEFQPRRRSEFYHLEIQRQFLEYCRDNGYLER